MRVTKAIREYVETEVRRKFDPVFRKVREPYNARREALIADLKKLNEEVNQKANELIASHGFSTRPEQKAFGFRDYAFEDKTAWAEVCKKEAELREREDRAIMDIIISLELGETTKDQLRAALDAVEV